LLAREGALLIELHMQRLDRSLLALQRWLRRSPLFHRLAVGTRILLAVGFIPTGLVKLLGMRFTRIDTTTPLGGFFETLYQSGLYWKFLGASQLVAGVLLLIPRARTLGAALFAPIIANIFVITLSYDFRGTPVLTAQMMLAVLFLLAWDYDRLRPLAGAAPQPVELPEHHLGPVERAVYVAGALTGLAFFTAVRGLMPTWVPPLWLLGASAALALLAVAIGLTRMVQGYRSSAPSWRRSQRLRSMPPP
jgi:uncharacterized membrane protein YphA (DoxX/SURF4 family)